jgi:MFS family permease
MADDPAMAASETMVGGKGWLNRNIIAMAVASFFSDFGHEMATAILPLFLNSIGASPAALGVIEGVADAVSSFVKLGSGYFSDRVGRRKAIAVTGYALTGITTGLFALATAWPHVLLARTAGWLGRGIRGPVRDAMLSESIAPEFRGRAFGFHRAGDTGGAFLGPAIAFLLVGVLSFQTIFLLTVIPGLLAALTFALVVEKRRAPNAQMRFWQTMRDLPQSFKTYMLGVGIFGAGNFAHSLLILRATQLLTPDMGAPAAGAAAIGLYTLHNALYALSSFPVGWLGDRFGKRGLLALGYLLFGVMALGFAIPDADWWYLLILFVLAGVYISMVDALEGATAADLLPKAVRGTGYGAMATVNGAGDFISSLVVGVLWAAVSPTVGFGYAALMAVVGAIIVYRVR